jgi:hypothetical protein
MGQETAWWDSNSLPPPPFSCVGCSYPWILPERTANLDASEVPVSTFARQLAWNCGSIGNYSTAWKQWPDVRSFGPQPVQSSPGRQRCRNAVSWQAHAFPSSSRNLILRENVVIGTVFAVCVRNPPEGLANPVIKDALSKTEGNRFADHWILSLWRMR